MDNTTEKKEPTKVPRRRFVGKRKTDGKTITTVKADGNEVVRQTKSRVHVGRSLNHIPDDIMEDEELNEAIKLLPQNYNFEIHKTVWNIRKHGAKRVALQMPEGLLIYSLLISDIL